MSYEVLDRSALADCYAVVGIRYLLENVVLVSLDALDYLCLDRFFSSLIARCRKRMT